jgi:hypothetical protein
MLPVAPGLAISGEQFAALIETCRHLERSNTAGRDLITLTIAA